jgi:hypothetical protein
VAVLDTEVVRIVPDFTKFGESVLKGAENAVKNIRVPVRIVPDASKFADDVDKIMRSRAFNADMKAVTAKVRLAASTAGFKASAEDEIKKKLPLDKVRAKVKLVADCKALKQSIKDCLDGSAVSGAVAKTKVKTEAEIDSTSVEKAGGEIAGRFLDTFNANVKNLLNRGGFEFPDFAAEDAEKAGVELAGRFRAAFDKAIGKVRPTGPSPLTSAIKLNAQRQREIREAGRTELAAAKQNQDQVFAAFGERIKLFEAERKLRRDTFSERVKLLLASNRLRDQQQAKDKAAADAEQELLDKQETATLTWAAGMNATLRSFAADEDKIHEDRTRNLIEQAKSQREVFAQQVKDRIKTRDDLKREADKAAKEQERQAKERQARLKAIFGGGGGGGAGEDLFGGIVDLGRRGVRPMNLLLGAVVAMGPVLIAMASSAAQASTSLVAMGAAGLGAASAVGVMLFAFNGLGDALKLYQQAAEGSATASAELDAQLRAMTPAARALFGELLAIKGEMGGFARLAQTAVLPGFTAFLRLIRQAPRGGASTVDILKMSMLDLGDIISTTTARMGVFASSEFFKGHLAGIVGENTAAFQNLADASLALLRPITRLVAAAAPQLTRFTQYLEDLANRFATWIDSFSDADLTAFFRDAGDQLARWGKLLTNIIDLLLGIGRASADAGGQLVDRLGDWIGRMADWVNGPGFDKLQGFFQFLADLPWAKIGAGLAGVATGLGLMYASRLVGFGGGGGGGGGLEGLLGLFGGGAAGAAGGPAGVAALVLLPKLLGSIKVGLFGIGAAFTYLYIQSDQFRATVNEIVTLFVDAFLPPVQQGMAVLLGMLQANRDEFIALAVAAGDLATALAPIAGKALGQGFQLLAITLAATIKIQVELARMFFVVSDASAASARVIITAYQAASAVIFTILHKTAEQAAKLMRATGNIVGAALVDKVVEGMAGVQQEINGVAENGKRILDDWSAYAQRKLAEMAGAAAKTGVGTWREKAPDVAGAVANAADLAKAQAALDAAQNASAASAARWADALTLANREIRDAQLGVRDAAWAISDAQKAIADAARDEINAQKDVTTARKDAAQAIADLRAQIKGLAVDEAEARYRLTVAKEVRKGFQYAKGIDPLLRQRLDLDVAQAEQGLNEIVRDGATARRELSDAERKGIERSDQVVAAKQRLKDIQDANLQRERDLIKANEAATRANETLRDAVDRRTRASRDSALAAVDEAKKVDAARKSYGDLTKEINKVPPTTKTQTHVYPIVHQPLLGREKQPPSPRDKRAAYTMSVYESQVPRQARAAGGPIYGVGDGQSDSEVIRASKGEFMQPRAAVNFYGTGGMEAIRRRIVPKQVLAGYAAGGPVGLDPIYTAGIGAIMGHQYAKYYGARQGNTLGAGLKVPPIITNFIVPSVGVPVGTGKWPLGGPWPPTPMHQRGDSGIWHGIMALVKASGIPYSFGNAYREGDDKWHGSGRAVDLMGFEQDRLAQFFMSLKANVLELIHTTRNGGYYITRGVRQHSMGVQDELHRNHLHVAMDSGGLLPPGDTFVRNRTGKPETVRTAGQENALRYVRLDTRDLKRLAAYIAVATDRPIDMDGRRVAEAVTSYTYLPAGGL